MCSKQQTNMKRSYLLVAFALCFLSLQVTLGGYRELIGFWRHLAAALCLVVALIFSRIAHNAGVSGGANGQTNMNAPTNTNHKAV